MRLVANAATCLAQAKGLPKPSPEPNGGGLMCNSAGQAGAGNNARPGR
jgi:hypothetical protein